MVRIIHGLTFDRACRVAWMLIAVVALYVAWDAVQTYGDIHSVTRMMMKP